MYDMYEILLLLPFAVDELQQTTHYGPCGLNLGIQRPLDAGHNAPVSNLSLEANGVYYYLCITVCN